MAAETPSSAQPVKPPAGGAGDAMTFPQVARLELDDSLERLIERAHDVLATQGRLRGLLDATRAISSDLDLPVLLRRTTQAACDLLGARYGALGVIGADGRLAEFITVGVDEETAHRIGHLPHGDGLLGELIRDPRPLRLTDLADHAASVGFPPGHPPMRGFLGAPVRVGERVFGNLYLSEKSVAGQWAEFTAEDEELLVALASTAGVAIDNARLFDVAERRQRWLQASADIVRDLVSEQGAPLSLVARRARWAAAADLAVVHQVDPREEEVLQVVAADGEAAESLRGTTWSRSHTLSGRVLDAGGDVVLDDAAAAGMLPVAGVPDGPVLLVRVPPRGDEVPGLVVLLRRRGGRRFDEEDLAMSADFTGHVALAIELGRAQEDRRRLALVEDRDRIARDLHDHVIQQLFASGLRMSALASRTRDPETSDALRGLIETGDETIRAIRSTIFELRSAREHDLRALLQPIVDEFGEVLGFAPALTFDGPVAASVPAAVAEHVQAALREMLSNCARHAQAASVGVHVEFSGRELRVAVTDDGVGLRDPVRRSGLANLLARAQALGGTCRSTSPLTADGRGTRVTWCVPTTR